jgi:hypothetical protein
MINVANIRSSKDVRNCTHGTSCLELGVILLWDYGANNFRFKKLDMDRMNVTLPIRNTSDVLSYFLLKSNLMELIN